MSETISAPIAAPAAVPDPVVAAPAAIEAPVVAEAPTPAAELPPAAAPSLLSDAPPTEPVAEPSPEPTPEPAAPPQPIAYQAFTYPEGVTADEAAVKPYTDILAAHQVPQEAAQELLNLYTAQQQRQIQANQDLWDRTRTDWRSQFTKDPEMGGNRQDTTLARCREAIDRYGGTPDQVKELRTLLTNHGLGDYPGLARLINNMAKRLSEGRPAPATMAKGPPARSTPNSRYGNSPSLPMNGAA